MKTILKLSFAALLFAFASCDDFLQREPMDQGSDAVYFNKVEDLEQFNNTYYTLFPRHSEWWGGVYSEDNNSDNQAGKSPNTLFYRGEKQTPQTAASEWKFSTIRNINYFLAKINEKRGKGMISGSDDLIDHYLGEAYFFRAYDYFRLLSTIGDAPIIENELPSDFASLVASSKRSPRNEVARFVLNDLDRAIDMMKPTPLKSGRLYKDVAKLMKARVALYEATWLKYHKGSAFTPGNDKWPGAAMYPNYQFPAGSIDDEILFFLDQAIEASREVAQSYSGDLTTPYSGLFNQIDNAISTNKEVLLARYALSGVLTHSATAYLRTGGGCGITQSFIRTFLMKSGKPYYAANEEYQGDLMVYYELQNRDLRLTQSVRNAGRILVNERVEDGVLRHDTLVYYNPRIDANGDEGNMTGYEVTKWISTVAGQHLSTKCTTAVPVFRISEAYLIYLEAYYERHGSLDTYCDIYWKALRKRAGVSEDYQATIDATDLLKENDLAVYSRGQLVDKTLYNIRRERRCEFVAEGFRLKDLRRWRALDNMQGYVMKGMNLWEKMHEFYNVSALTPEIVSQAAEGNYLLLYRNNPNSAYYTGFSFPKAHYLEPIPVGEIIMCSPGGDVSRSTIYQNPAWPNRIGGTADYSVNLD